MAGLGLALVSAVFLITVLSPVCVQSRPMRGKFTDIIISPSGSEINGSCHLMGMYNGSTISIKATLSKEDANSQVGLNIVVKVFKLRCANFLQLEDSIIETPCSSNGNLEGLVGSDLADLRAGIVIPIKNFTETKRVIKFGSDMTEYKSGKTPLILQPSVGVPSSPAPADENKDESDDKEGAATDDKNGGSNTDDNGGGSNTDDKNEGSNTGDKNGGSNADDKNEGSNTGDKNGGSNTKEDSNVTDDKKKHGDGDATSNKAKREVESDNKKSDASGDPAEGNKTAEGDKTAEGNKTAEGDKTATGDKAKPKPMEHDVAITIGRVPNTGKKVANITKEDGVYLIQVYVQRLTESGEKAQITAEVEIEVRNPHGYLSAVDYPALVFFGIMTSVYAILAMVWIVLMLCSFRDLVRLQFWILAVIMLGFLEKTFFVAEYSAINLGTDTYGSYFIAEFVSAIKRGISRMLLIIVAMGFGTVKPRLGDSLVKVVGVGVAFIVLTFIDGIMRARSETFHTSDTSSVVTLALLLLLDTFIFYWIFTAIVDTRRTLRLRKNYVKLAMYNHFAYTLMFAIIATIGFLVWVFVDLEYPSGMCLTDWREVWLRDCFWHVLFAFILLVVMIIWRPSSNRSRFAYSLVTDQDNDEILFEQGNNKNFETVKMRSVSKSEPPPPVTSQAEDDLRWVEENLPTTAMDKALPLLLDSDEEVMTTKFEMSKMN